MAQCPGNFILWLEMLNYSVDYIGVKGRQGIRQCKLEWVTPLQALGMGPPNQRDRHSAPLEPLLDATLRRKDHWAPCQHDLLGACHANIIHILALLLLHLPLNWQDTVVTLFTHMCSICYVVGVNNVWQHYVHLLEASANACACTQGSGSLKASLTMDGVLVRDLQLRPTSKFAYLLRPLPARAAQLDAYAMLFRRRILRVISTSKARKRYRPYCSILEVSGPLAPARISRLQCPSLESKHCSSLRRSATPAASWWHCDAICISLGCLA